MKHKMVFLALTALMVARAWAAQKVVKKASEAKGSLTTEVIKGAVARAQGVQFKPETFKPLEDRQYGEACKAFERSNALERVPNLYRKIAGALRPTRGLVRVHDEFDDEPRCESRVLCHGPYAGRELRRNKQKRSTAVERARNQLEENKSLKTDEERKAGQAELEAILKEYDASEIAIVSVVADRKWIVDYLSRKINDEVMHRAKLEKVARSFVRDMLSTGLQGSSRDIYRLDKRRAVVEELIDHLSGLCKTARGELKDAQKFAAESTPEVITQAREAITRAQEANKPSTSWLSSLW